MTEAMSTSNIKRQIKGTQNIVAGTFSNIMIVIPFSTIKTRVFRVIEIHKVAMPGSIKKNIFMYLELIIFLTNFLLIMEKYTLRSKAYNKTRTSPLVISKT